MELPLLPPLYDEKGELIRDRFIATIRVRGREEKHVCASEWGLLGWIDQALRDAGENGRRQVYVTFTAEPGEKTGTLGKMPSAPNP